MALWTSCEETVQRYRRHQIGSACCRLTLVLLLNCFMNNYIVIVLKDSYQYYFIIIFYIVYIHV